MPKEFEKLWLSQWTVRIAYVTGTSNPEYIGEAKPGTADSSTGWRIKKLTYSGNNVTHVRWASGNRNFDKEWDERTSYTYT